MSQRKAKEYRQAMEQYRGVVVDVDDLKRRIGAMGARPRREDRDSAGSKKTRPHAVGTSLKTVSRYHPAWTHRRIPLGPDHEGQSGKFTPALGALFQFQLPGPYPSDSFTRKPFQPVGFPLWSRENDESTGSGSSPLSLFICW